MANVAGILLAAGAGRRMGRPKALMRAVDGTPWLTAAGRALHDGGCSPVVVVLGAAAEEARALLNGLDVQALEAGDWATGMGASLRTGLASLAEGVGRPDRDGYGDDPALTTPDAARIHLVDLPDVGPDVVARVVDRAAPDVLARADYGHGPAHPVLIGREHWPGVIASAQGDRGARDYLRGRDVLAVDCSDLATGRDIDTPADL
ncbi:nucleotidyltransferase family protein [Pseudactinotalea sp. Z1732]|uniref:nucleotidyltransferase family protein n=1 Tax=Pseudactinotalea sp. Z1732 TaxID=3413026 RepID=UPI003C7C1333